MDNIFFEISENSKIENECKNENNDEIVDVNENINDMDTFVAKQLDYQENYLLADLKKIAEFYDISVRKLRKEEIIQEIVLFEINPENSMTYLHRLQAWHWLTEFKKDPKLKQYVIW